jgi:hypothetical protein
VLYGDDSDSEAGGDEEENCGDRKKGGGIFGGARLRIDNNQPVDLLESAVSQVTRKLKPLQSILSNICFQRRLL